MIHALAGGRHVGTCAALHVHVSLSSGMHNAETQRNRFEILSYVPQGQEEPSGAPSRNARVTALTSLTYLYLVRFWEHREAMRYIHERQRRHSASGDWKSYSV